MKYTYERVEFENNPAWNAEVPGGEYAKTIDEHAGNGERYAGWLPVKSGPTGKLLSIDLVFEKE